MLSEMVFNLKAFQDNAWHQFMHMLLNLYLQVYYFWEQ